MTEQMNVPTLRFVDFSNTWRNEKLGNVVEISSGDSPSKFKMVEEGIPFFKVEQLNNSTKYQTDSIYFINEPKKVISKGSVIFPKRGASILLNKIRILKQPSFMDTNLMTLTANEQLNNEYLYYFILREDLSTLADTTSIPQINNKHILPYPIALPTLPEQQKIASFLSKVDEKLGLLSEKKDKLTEYKHGVMLQLFNGKWHEQDGQLTFTPPTLRFKADDGSEFPDWEEDEVGNYTEQLNGFAFKSEDLIEGQGNYPLMRGINITEGNIRHSVEMDRFYSGDISKLTKYFLEEHDLVIGMDGSKVGKNVALVTSDDVGSLLVQRVARLRPKPNTSIMYIYQNIIAEKFRRYVDIVNTSSGIPHISKKQIDEYKIGFPCFDEQTKIANFLSTIDKKIELANSELNKAKEWKKGLLQQMFV